MDDLQLSILLFVAVLTVTCGAQQLLSTSSPNGMFSKMVYSNNSLYIGGSQYVYKFNTSTTLLQEDKKESICNESCVSNVNKILLVNSTSSELIECSSGDRGVCKVRDLHNLTVKWKSSTPKGDEKFETGLTVSTDKEVSAQAHLTENNYYLAIAVTNGSGVGNKFKNYFPIFLWSVISPHVTSRTIFAQDVNDYTISYVASFMYGHYSFFFTNQMNFPNRTNMVSKVVRLNQKFVTPMNSYTDFVIECKDKAGKAYNILKDAILIPIASAPTVAATFTTHSSDDGSILCTLPLQDINNQSIESWINFMNKTCSNTMYGSYFLTSGCGTSGYKPDIARIASVVREGDTYDFAFFYSVDWTVLQMKYVASSTSQEGMMVTMHASNLNNQPVLMVGTSTGSVLQFVYTDGTYRRYNTLKVTDSSILSLYQHTDHSLFVLTKMMLYKYGSTQCRLQYPGSNCAKSGVMAGKNPLCGWCIYEQRVSLKSDCACNTTECWLSSLTSCITLDIEPKGATNGTGTVVIQLTPSLRLPNGQYFCRWQNETIKNATIEVSTFSCRMENKNFSNNIKLTLEFGVKVDKTEILLTEAPFLIYNCSNFKKCGECITTMGADCTWCPFEGQCRLPNDDCTPRVTESSACPQLANLSDLLYITSGINQSLKINIINNIFNETTYRLLVDGVEQSPSCTAASSHLECSVMGIVNDTKMKKPLSMQYLSTSNVWVYLDDNYTKSVTIYNCRMLAERGCNYCKALNTARYKCAWDKTKCVFNDTSGARLSAQCPPPTINQISPDDGPYSGTVIVTLTGDEFGLVETEPIAQYVIVSGKSCSAILENMTYVPDDPLDFHRTVRTGFRCQASAPVLGDSTKFVISGQESILNTRSLILKNSTITHVYPVYGPRAGGTKITLYGENLGIGNRVLNTLTIQNKGLIGFNIVNNSKGKDDYVIIGEIPIGNFTGNETFVVSLNEVDISPKNVTFSFLVDPVIKNIAPDHGFLSGGTILTVSGDNLGNVQLPRVFIQNYEAESSESCFPAENSSQILYCKVPIAPADIKTLLNSGRQKRSTTDCQDCKEVTIVVKLDGIEKTFTLKYYHDPSLSKFTNGMQMFNADDQFLTVNGDNLAFLKHSDVTITIGIEPSWVVQIEPNSIKCVAPRTQPKPGIQGAEYPEVNITIGNINQTLGQLQYQKDVNYIVIIAGAVGGTVVFVGVLAFVLICLKYRKTRSKARELEDDLNKLEMEIKSVARQEGHDNVHYDVIPDDITEREATSYTALQVTEMNLYTALNVRLENNDEEPDNDSALETHYADVEIPKNDGLGQTNTDSEPKV